MRSTASLVPSKACGCLTLPPTNHTNSESQGGEPFDDVESTVYPRLTIILRDATPGRVSGTAADKMGYKHTPAPLYTGLLPLPCSLQVARRISLKYPRLQRKLVPKLPTATSTSCSYHPLCVQPAPFYIPPELRPVLFVVSNIKHAPYTAAQQTRTSTYHVRQ